MKQKYDAIKNFLACLDRDLIFLAPPAWGKTSLVQYLLESNQEFNQRSGRNVIYLAPLRAIVEEVSDRFIDNSTDRFSARFSGHTNFKAYSVETFLHQLDQDGVDLVSTKNTLFVIDELHLFFDWGQSFRPILLEVLTLVLWQAPQVLLMTASLKDLTSVTSFLLRFRMNLYLLDAGNLQFLYPPVKTIKAVSYLIYFRLFLELSRVFLKTKDPDSAKYEDGVILVFFRKRSSVLELTRILNWLGIPCLGCVGGRRFVQEFRSKLKLRVPSVILSTSVLGHGVNLPKIKSVFICYQEPNPSLVFQMMARGGRQGERFIAYRV